MSERTSLLTWLWKPFDRIAGGPALGLGLAAIVLTGALAAPTNTHLDGVLDTHVGLPAPFWIFPAEGIVNWLSLAIVLWIAGAILKGPRAFRAIDLFGTQALARWPFLFTVLACYLPPFRSMTDKLNEAVAKGILVPQATAIEWLVFFLVSFLMLFIVVWFVALAWKSFRISCDVRGWKAVVAFIVAVIIAEVISKVAIIGGLLPLR